MCSRSLRGKLLSTVQLCYFLNFVISSLILKLCQVVSSCVFIEFRSSVMSQNDVFYGDRKTCLRNAWCEYALVEFTPNLRLWPRVWPNLPELGIPDLREFVAFQLVPAESAVSRSRHMWVPDPAIVWPPATMQGR